MTSIISFKFLEDQDYDTIPFDGEEINLHEFKRRVLIKRSLTQFATDIEFIVTDTEKEYTYVSHKESLKAGSKVKITRRPAKKDSLLVRILQRKQQKVNEPMWVIEPMDINNNKMSEEYKKHLDAQAGTKFWTTALDKHDFGDRVVCATRYPIKKPEPINPNSLAAQPGNQDILKATANFRLRIQYQVSEGDQGYPSAVPRGSYICNRCNRPGHFKHLCPMILSNFPETKIPNTSLPPITQVKMATGIPRSELIELTEYVPGCYLTPRGTYAITRTAAEAVFHPTKRKQDRDPDDEDERPEKLNELRCEMCWNLIEEPTMMNCCGATYCRICLVKHLIEFGYCPSCKAKDKEVADTVRNDAACDIVDHYRQLEQEWIDATWNGPVKKVTSPKETTKIENPVEFRPTIEDVEKFIDDFLAKNQQLTDEEHEVLVAATVAVNCKVNEAHESGSYPPTQYPMRCRRRFGRFKKRNNYLNSTWRRRFRFDLSPLEECESEKQEYSSRYTKDTECGPQGRQRKPNREESERDRKRPRREHDGTNTSVDLIEEVLLSSSRAIQSNKKAIESESQGLVSLLSDKNDPGSTVQSGAQNENDAQRETGKERKSKRQENRPIIKHHSPNHSVDDSGDISPSRKWSKQLGNKIQQIETRRRSVNHKVSRQRTPMEPRKRHCDDRDIQRVINEEIKSECSKIRSTIKHPTPIRDFDNSTNVYSRRRSEQPDKKKQQSETTNHLDRRHHQKQTPMEPRKRHCDDRDAQREIDEERKSECRKIRSTIKHPTPIRDFDNSTNVYSRRRSEQPDKKKQQSETTNHLDRRHHQKQTPMEPRKRHCDDRDAQREIDEERKSECRKIRSTIKLCSPIPGVNVSGDVSRSRRGSEQPDKKKQQSETIKRSVDRTDPEQQTPMEPRKRHCDDSDIHPETAEERKYQRQNIRSTIKHPTPIRRVDASGYISPSTRRSEQPDKKKQQSETRRRSVDHTDPEQRTPMELRKRHCDDHDIHRQNDCRNKFKDNTKPLRRNFDDFRHKHRRHQFY
ncbi:hypothetical protein ACOME3_003375 [Neoechinorhynchus agilis]